MPRIRSLKPEHKQHRKVGKLSDFVYRLWVGLLTEADDVGRLVADPDQIRILIFPYHARMTAPKIEAGLNALSRVGLCRCYTVAEVPYVELPSFPDHQRISHPAKSRLPGPPAVPNPPEDSGGFARTPEDSGILASVPQGSEGSKNLRRGSERSDTRPPRRSPPEDSGAVLSDGQFIAALRANPAYQGIDLDIELAKMDAYLLTPKARRRKKTRGFIVAWLNRIDREPPSAGPADNGSRRSMGATPRRRGISASWPARWNGSASVKTDRERLLVAISAAPRCSTARSRTCRCVSTPKR